MARAGELGYGVEQTPRYEAIQPVVKRDRGSELLSMIGAGVQTYAKVVGMKKEDEAKTLKASEKKARAKLDKKIKAENTIEGKSLARESYIRLEQEIIDNNLKGREAAEYRNAFFNNDIQRINATEKEVNIDKLTAYATLLASRVDKSNASSMKEEEKLVTTGRRNKAHDSIVVDFEAGTIEPLKSIADAYNAGGFENKTEAGKFYIESVSAMILEKTETDSSYDPTVDIEQLLKIKGTDGVDYASHPVYKKLIDDTEAKAIGIRSKASSLVKDVYREEIALAMVKNTLVSQEDKIIQDKRLTPGDRAVLLNLVRTSQGTQKAKTTKEAEKYLKIIKDSFTLKPDGSNYDAIAQADHAGIFKKGKTILERVYKDDPETLSVKLRDLEDTIRKVSYIKSDEAILDMNNVERLDNGSIDIDMFSGRVRKYLEQQSGLGNGGYSPLFKKSEENVLQNIIANNPDRFMMDTIIYRDYKERQGKLGDNANVTISKIGLAYTDGKEKGLDDNVILQNMIEAKNDGVRILSNTNYQTKLNKFISESAPRIEGSEAESWYGMPSLVPNSKFSDTTLITLKDLANIEGRIFSDSDKVTEWMSKNTTSIIPVTTAIGSPLYLPAQVIVPNNVTGDDVQNAIEVLFDEDKSNMPSWYLKDNIGKILPTDDLEDYDFDSILDPSGGTAIKIIRKDTKRNEYFILDSEKIRELASGQENIGSEIRKITKTK